MSDARDSILRGLAEVEAHLRGDPAPGSVVHVPDVIDVVAIRKRTGLSRTKFSAWIGVSARTVENWEQGRRVPQGPARVLLAIVASDPGLVHRILAA